MKDWGRSSRLGQLAVVVSLCLLSGIGIWMLMGDLRASSSIAAIVVITIIGGLVALSTLPETFLVLSGTLFLVANLYLQVPALLYAISKVSFLDLSVPEHGMVKVALLSGVTVFSVFQVMLVMSRLNTSPVPSRQINSFRRRRSLRLYSAFLITTGFVFIAMVGWPSNFSGNSFNYQRISDSLRGNGIQMRLAELAAVGGLLLVVTHDRWSRWFLAGSFVLVFYCLWRAGFGNRENAVKYLVVWFIAHHLRREKSRGAGFVLVLFVGLMVASFLIPWVGVVRAKMPLTFQSYLYLSQRDFGMAELDGNLAEGNVKWTPPGVVMGVVGSIGGLLPRSLFPGKPEADAVAITALTTPVSGYDPSRPQFAYAPSYIGQEIYWWPGGYFIVCPLMAGLIAALAIRFARRKSDIDIKMFGARESTYALRAVVVYAAFFSAVKLDLYNLLTSSVVPIVAIVGGIVVSRIRI